MAQQKQIQKKNLSASSGFVNLRGKSIFCYFAYAYVANENQALDIRLIEQLNFVLLLPQCFEYLMVMR